MKNIKQAITLFLFTVLGFTLVAPSYAQTPTSAGEGTIQTQLPFTVPNLTTILSFIIQFFFTIAALVALLYLLLGALAWITSGGDKESVKKAQDKIQNALLGLILIVVVLAAAVTLEKVVFQGNICFGITCPLKLPSLLQSK